ncbi:MAG: TIGR00341 family protein, partial [Duncaniella sp.]|nr:TIGR00341 family protein [Duncaniella sp.]
KKVRRIVYNIAILTLLPSIYLTYNMLRQTRFSMTANRFVAHEFQFPSTRVLSTSAHIENGQKIIDVTLIGKILPADSLRLAMSAQMKFYGIQGATLNIVQGDSPVLPSQSSISNSSMRDIYEMAQATIAARQTTIDSLRAVIAICNMNDSASAALGPELRVIFPEIKDIAISRPIFNNIDANRLDTASGALVRYSTTLSGRRRTELQKYLQARLRLRSISIVDVGNSIKLPADTITKTSPTKK